MTRPSSLRNSRDFKRVYDAGRKASRDGITVFVAPAPSGDGRIGYVVPSSIGGAVARNRTKRRLRSIVAATPLVTGLDVVVRTRAEAATLKFQDLEKHVKDALAATEAVA